jgi:hypothetical protein
MNPILNRVHLSNLRVFELFFDFENGWILLIEFVESFGDDFAAVSNSGNNALEKVFLFTIKLAQGIDVLFEIACKDVLEVSGLLDLKRSN